MVDQGLRESRQRFDLLRRQPVERNLSCRTSIGFSASLQPLKASRRNASYQPSQSHFRVSIRTRLSYGSSQSLYAICTIFVGPCIHLHRSRLLVGGAKAVAIVATPRSHCALRWHPAVTANLVERFSVRHAATDFGSECWCTIGFGHGVSFFVRRQHHVRIIVAGGTHYVTTSMSPRHHSCLVESRLNLPAGQRRERRYSRRRSNLRAVGSQPRSATRSVWLQCRHETARRLSCRAP